MAQLFNEAPIGASWSGFRFFPVLSRGFATAASGTASPDTLPRKKRREICRVAEAQKPLSPGPKQAERQTIASLAREISSAWVPCPGQTVSMLTSMREVALGVILKAVFGVQDGAQRGVRCARALMVPYARPSTSKAGREVSR